MRKSIAAAKCSAARGSVSGEGETVAGADGLEAGRAGGAMVGAVMGGCYRLSAICTRPFLERTDSATRRLGNPATSFIAVGSLPRIAVVRVSPSHRVAMLIEIAAPFR
jgi:hypothetical protein